MVAEVGQLDQILAESDRSKWNVFGQTGLILSLGAVLALELDHHIDKDPLVGETQEELAVELELG